MAESNSVTIERLARERYETTLTRAELRLIRSAAAGETAVCGPNQDPNDTQNDLSHSDTWGRNREIRAEVIRWLCTDGNAKQCVDPWGIDIYGARIKGTVGLGFAQIPFQIQIKHSRCDELDFARASIPMVDLEESWIGSLNLTEAVILRSVFLRNGFRCDGTANLADAQIAGDLDFLGAQLVGPKPDGTALSGDRVVVKGGVFLRGARVTGAVSFIGAQIDGDFDFERAELLSPKPGGTALNGDGVVVKGEVFLNGTRAVGAVRFVGAQIDGDLDANGANLKNPDGAALSVDRAVIKGAFFLSVISDAAGKPQQAAHVYGELHLGGCHISGDVDFHGARLFGRQGTTLTMSRAVLGGALFLNNTRVRGPIDLNAVRIDGAFDMRGLELIGGDLDLRNASAAALIDDEDHWPAWGSLHLDGFVYGRISDSKVDVETRLRWLDLDTNPSFNPQPYRQIAKVMRDSGKEDDARRVLVEMERRQRWQGNFFWERLLSPPYRGIAGYGHEPERALWGLGLLTAFGWVTYRRAYLVGNVVPTDKEAYQSFRDVGYPPHHHRAFSPFLYSVENTFPLVKLGQADKWQPEPKRQPALPPTQGGTYRFPNESALWRKPIRWLNRRLRPKSPRVQGLKRLTMRIEEVLSQLGLRHPPPWERRSNSVTRGPSPRTLRTWLWIQIVLGWLLATVFVAGVSGIFRRD